MNPEREARVRAGFRAAFAGDVSAAYREWYSAQRALAEDGEAALCAALADDLWERIPELERRLGEERGGFFNNLGAFFGTPGPAASLARAEECFARSLDAWAGDDEKLARALHNRGSALASLGESEADLSRAAEALEAALGYRTREREIARAVTLHHLGIARRKLAELSGGGAASQLERSAAALSEALEIRGRLGLASGKASTRFQLAVTFAALGRTAEARRAFEIAAEELEACGSPDRARAAREEGARLARGE
jgi:tetratricopeptide (TPR) repeat protein